MPAKNLENPPQVGNKSCFGDDLPTFGFATQKIEQKLSFRTPLVRPGRVLPFHAHQ
ncbi:hypothetical protein [Herbaspirillum sp.]|uniref:hypothetical protein n=1 Tax=Herbaspirillum sp. TaxID=1890675 RepID=UPI002D78697F|nr:hypothetical protein [Herbaspirillum sp.]